MLAKKHRILIQNYHRRGGKILKNRYFQLKIFSGSQFSRFGVVISKAVSPKATIRNTIKRAIFRFFADIYRVLPVADYLIIVHPETRDLNSSQIEESLRLLTQTI